MAKKNLNVILISRSQDKLSNVSDEIASKYKVETRTIQADFTRNDIYEKIGKEIKDLDIGVLVNNVGMTYDYPKDFTKVSEKHLHDLINCNIMSATMMSKIVLEGMQRRERGLIINMSSIVHLFPSPYLLVYASLKQFLVSFSKGLAEETKANNVTVQCVIPGIVTTKFSGVRNTNLLITTPESYATTSNFFTNFVHESIVINFTSNFLRNYKLKAIKRINKMAAKQKNVQEKVTEINEVSETATSPHV
ncbi:Very-long-chain 3-oxoacyl-CoA reductase [Armadillidium nasatum]|uniref:Very-long-chain 3-oxoacyl-CoA reductase n=1 Tax=Armadillidium nasatum TaxID=96803 RepID=A0A5N5SMQ7_9CRUS|nr:Very-long-chain 3-oxoacyl-CoA reductase [Armadillidium nasatum]